MYLCLPFAKANNPIAGVDFVKSLNKMYPTAKEIYTKADLSAFEIWNWNN